MWCVFSWGIFVPSTMTHNKHHNAMNTATVEGQIEVTFKMMEAMGMTMTPEQKAELTWQMRNMAQTAVMGAIESLNVLKSNIYSGKA